MPKEDAATPLFAASRIRALGEHLDGLKDVHPGWSGGDEALLWRLGRAALEAAWAAGTGLSGPPDAMDRLLALAGRDAGFVDLGEQEMATLAAVALAMREPSLRPRLLGLQSSARFDVQYALVRALDAARPDERAALEHLAGSPFDHVANAARSRLEKAGETAWWCGVFRSDPLAGLGPDEACAQEPALRRYAELFAHQREAKDEGAALCAMLAGMGPAAARAALPALLACCWSSKENLAEALVGALREPADAVLICEAVESGDRALHRPIESALEAALGRLAAPVRSALALDCLRRARTAPPADLQTFMAPAYTLLMICGKAWPEDEDSRPVVDFLLACGASELPYLQAVTWLQRPVRRGFETAPWGRDLLREWLAEPEARRLRFLGWELQGATGAWPAQEQLALALPLLGQPVPSAVASWLAKTLRDVAPERLEEHWDDPVLRPALFQMLNDESLQWSLLARARRELREGRLDAQEAQHVAWDAGLLWGGDLWWAAPFWNLRWDSGSDEEVEACGIDGPPERKFDEDALARRAAVDKALGPELSGPLSPAEWDIVRRLRAGLTDAQLDAGIATSYPLGRWHPVDRTHFLRCLERAWVRRDAAELDRLAMLAETRPDPAFLPLLREAAGLADDDEHARIGTALALHERLFGTSAAGSDGTAPGDEW